MLVTTGGLGMMLSRQARRVPVEERPVVWFRYLRIAGWLMPTCMVVWCGFVSSMFKLTRESVLYEIDLAWLSVWMVLLLAPPFLASLVFQLTSRPVLGILRGASWTAREVVSAWFWGVVSLLVPGILVFAGILLAKDGDFRAAAAAVGVGALLFFLGSNRRNESSGLELRALDSGELRDRVFELARKAKVRARSVMIAHSSRGPVLNAFAATGGVVVLAEDLVRALPREELDAVIAHELGHLQHRHIPLLMIVAVGPLFLLAWLFSLAPIGFIAEHNLYLAIPGAILIGGFVSRRVEHHADEAASRMIEDPEAFIRMLGRLIRLNMLPSRWTGWDVKVMSHPSLEQRAARTAQRFRIPVSRVEELLEADSARSASYLLPPAQKELEWVAYRQRSGVQNLGIYIGSLVIPPVVGSWFATQVPQAVLWTSLAALTLLIVRIISSWAIRCQLLEVEHKIRVRIGESGGILVGLRPAREPRHYDGFPYWDLGVVRIDGPVLRYSSERMSFGLKASECRSVTLIQSAPGWFQPKAVAFETGSAVFSLIARERRAQKRLLQDVQTWRASSAECTNPLPPPAFPVVSSLGPRETALSGSMLTVLILVGVASLAGTAFLAPRWTLMPSLVSMGVMVVDLLPSILYREPS